MARKRVTVGPAFDMQVGGKPIHMDRLRDFALPSWSLPAIVAAIVVPVVVAAVVLGPVAAAGAALLVAGAIVVAAARSGAEEELEVARSGDRRHRGLILLLAPIARQEDAEALRGVLEDASRPFPAQAQSLVIAPALDRPLTRWLSDVDPARRDASHRLGIALDRLRRSGVSVRGEVADSADPVQACEDVLRTFPADDLIVVRAEQDGAIEELRRRLDRPVRELRVIRGSDRFGPQSGSLSPRPAAPRRAGRTPRARAR